MNISDKLKKIIPTLKWKTNSTCSITANLTDKFRIIASQGHSGCSFIKTFSFWEEEALDNTIFIENEGELVELAYKSFHGHHKKSELESIINKISENLP